MTPTPALTLSGFLLARYDEEEATARDATQGPWRAGTYATEHAVLTDDRYLWVVKCGYTSDGERDMRHIIRHDPTRVLADCEAKRLTVRFLSDLERGEFGDSMTSSLAYSTLCSMAAVYADHPHFREEWT